VLRVAYVGRTVTTRSSASIQTHSGSNCTNAAGCTAGGTPGTTKSTVPQGAQYIPVQSRPNPYLGAGSSSYTEGNTSYNALQTDVTQRLSHGPLPRKLYVVEEPRHEFRIDCAQSNNQAQMVLDRNDLPRTGARRP